MTFNDVLGRLRYIFNYGDAEMVAVFAAADHAATEEQVRYWLLDEENPLFAKISDRELATFLNGLINHKLVERVALVEIVVEQMGLLVSQACGDDWWWSGGDPEVVQNSGYGCLCCD